MYFTVSNILLSVSFLTTGVLSTLLIFKSKVQSSKFLSLTAYSATLWILAQTISMNTNNSLVFVASIKIVYITGVFILTLFTFFSYSFLGLSIKTNKKLLYGGILATILLFLSLVFTEGVITTTSLNNIQVVGLGPFYSFYSFYIIGMTLLSFYYLIKKSRNTTDKIKKGQLTYVGAGAIISLMIGLIFSIILPFFGYFDLRWLGPLFTVIFVTFSTLAIFKHHLFNIKVISVEFFSTLITVFVLIDALLAKTFNEFILKFGVFLGVAIISILIIRAVLNEIKSKEKITKISQDLKLANVELKRLDRTKSEFLSIASHQLRTPLTAIKGYSSMVLEGEFGELNTKLKEVINRIFQSSQRLVLMIEDFLNVSRIELGKMKYDFTNFDLKEVIKNIIEDFKTNNSKVGKLNLQFIAEKENFKIDGDQNKIRQIVSNVIDNAIKYTEKGFVKVFLEHTDTNSVRIKIQDSGAGIRKEDLSRIFQKFTRASGGEKTHSEGSGLGLYVARIIVEDHNGKIWAESNGPGKGSAFFIELPVS